MRHAFIKFRKGVNMTICIKERKGSNFAAELKRQKTISRGDTDEAKSL